MVNLDNLKNLTVPNFVPEIDPETILTEMPAIANQNTNNYFGLAILTAICIVMIYTLNREDWIFRLDVVRSGVYSTGFCTVIGLLMLLGGFIVNYQHVMYFGVPFIFLLIMAYFRKEKGL